MTTHGGAVPTQQNCPNCNALVYYEGHSELASNLVPHRFHCHACGGVFLVRSTSHKPPRFRITMRHAAAGPGEAAAAEAIAHQSHDHGDDDAHAGEDVSADALPEDQGRQEPAVTAEESPASEIDPASGTERTE